MCKHADRGWPAFYHVIGEAGGPWSGASSVTGYNAIEFFEGGWVGEFACEVGADVVHARNVREGLPEEMTDVVGDAATCGVSEQVVSVVE